MSRLAILLAFAALTAPAAALAAPTGPDAALDEFRNICGASGGDYTAIVKAADASGWADAQPRAEADDTVSVTSTSAKAKTVDGVDLMLLATQGLMHTKSGAQVPVSTCKISSNKADADLMARAQAWMGFAPDSGDATLATYFVKPAAGKPQHVPQNQLNAALASGGFSIVKVQQDSDGAILVYQTYSK
jgi:hypothetical protein